VCFFSNRTRLVLTGQSVYAWVERLVPYLDGRRSLAQLTTDLPAGKKAMVEEILAALLARGLIRDVDQDVAHDLADWELDRYAAEIAYVESFRDSAAARFQRFRRSRLIVVGAGRTFTAAVSGVLRAGALRVTAVVTAECTTHLDSLTEIATEECDSDQRLECRHDVCGDELTALVVGADMVLHATDRQMPGRALRLDGLCAARATGLAQAVVWADEVWVGPTTDPAVSGSRWEAGWRRRQPAAGADIFLDRPDVEASVYLSGAATALVGNLVGLTAFRYLTGVAADDERHTMTRVDLATLRTSTHRFVPHPLARPAAPTGRADLLATVARAVNDSRVDEAEFDRRLTRLVDDRLGVIGEVSERDFTQLPLCVAAVTVPAAGPGPASTVTGCGLDFRTARLRAAARAVELHALLAVDTRRLCRGGATVWAYDVVDGTARELDATAVFAGSRPVGLASGFSWADAVQAGLLDHCRSHTVTEALSGVQAFAHVDVAGVDLDEDGATYRKLLELAGVDVEVYDITGVLGVPTVAFRTAMGFVAHTNGTDRSEALRAGLELVLLDHQSRLHGELAYAPPPVPQLSLTGAGTPATAPLMPVAGPAAALAAAGRRPFAVPLDHDAALWEILPVVRVVLVDD